MILSSPHELAGLRTTVMGLGLHGGGVAAVRYLAAHGAEVTVTDLRGEDVLSPSLEALAGVRLRCVLGRHEEADFKAADLVIKNPGVPRHSPYLQAARRVETDISLFLRFARNPVIAITGSKGKSTVASAVHHGLVCRHPTARLGGNITTSPLAFLDSLTPDDPVVLELSSFQLGDLALTGASEDKAVVLDPVIAVLTNIMRDHLDYYSRIEDYINDKSMLFAEQSREHAAVYNHDDLLARRIADRHVARAYWFSQSSLPLNRTGVYVTNDELYLQYGGERFGLGTAPRESIASLLPINRAIAALTLWLYGVPADELGDTLTGFRGIEHRLEPVGERYGVRYVNDSAATIPPATAAALDAVQAPVRLIAGGSDKSLDLEPFVAIAGRVRGLYLLAGSATDRIIELLRARELPYHGPYAELAECVRAAASAAAVGEVVMLSPGCASFGMFLNEFDRGRKFKTIVEQIITKEGAI